MLSLQDSLLSSSGVCIFFHLLPVIGASTAVETPGGSEGSNNPEQGVRAHALAPQMWLRALGPAFTPLQLPLANSPLHEVAKCQLTTECVRKADCLMPRKLMES